MKTKNPTPSVWFRTKAVFNILLIRILRLIYSIFILVLFTLYMIPMIISPKILRKGVNLFLRDTGPNPKNS